MLCFPYIAVGTTSGSIFLDVVHSIRKQRTYLRFSEVMYIVLLLHRWRYPPIQTTINHLKHQFYSCCIGKYNTGGGVLKPLYSTCTSALTNIYIIYIYIYIYMFVCVLYVHVITYYSVLRVSYVILI